MTFNDFLVGIGVLVGILVPFGIAVGFAVRSKTQMDAMKEDIKELKSDVKDLTRRVDNHITTMDLMTRFGLLGSGKGESPKE